MRVDRVAVELNRELVPRDRWTATPVSDGDRLEIVHFVGGGVRAASGSPTADILLSRNGFYR